MTALKLSNSDLQNYIFKVIVVGEGGVGKTSLCMRVTRDIFSADYKLTLGTAFFSYQTALEEMNANIAIQIWDLGGQSKFGSILRSFTQNAKGTILAFDISCMDSFIAIQDRWKIFLKNNLPTTPIILISTKNDLSNEHKEVSDELVQNFIEAEHKSGGLDIVAYIQTSSKLAINAHECFKELARHIILRNETE
ncbi:MAG: Rab family GTPase [Candidatus Hodarchaeota archaeon]